MKDNAMRVGKVCLGNYKRAADYQLRKFEEDLPSIDTSHVFVTDSSGMDREDERVIEALAEKIPLQNIHHTQADCVVSSHCGPKTIGILYLLKKKSTIKARLQDFLAWMISSVFRIADF